jgi:hypothetical protein
MRSTSLLPLLVLALTAGCARASRPAGTADTFAATVHGPIRATAHRTVTPSDRGLAAAPPIELRRAGDYVVHRISGSFRRTPLRLTQKVISVDRGLVTVEVILASDSAPRSAKNDSDAEGGARLRVVFDRTPGAQREVAKVTRLIGDREEPGTLEDYELLMAETVMVPDRNEDLIGTEVVSAKVGDRAVDCKKTSYRVAIGKKTGVLSTLTSEGFAWGDVGGEIRADDGKILYRAEVVESGSRATATASAER